MSSLDRTLEAKESLKVSPRALVVLGLAGLVYVLAALERISPPVVALDIMKSLAIGPDSMSLMFSATFFVYAFTQPLAGFGADRFGPKVCLLTSVGLLALASIWFAKSQSHLSATLARALVGFAAGFAFVPAVRLAANWLPGRYFGLASSCILAGSALSNFLAGWPLAKTATAFGWRWSFMGLGLILVGFFILVLFIVSDGPKRQISEALKASGEAGAAGAESQKSQTKQSLGFWASTKLVLSAPIFWLISLVYTGTDLLYDTFTGLWAGPYLMEVYSLSSIEAGNMLSLAAFGFLVGGPLVVTLGDKLGSYGNMIIGLALGNLAITSFIIWGPAIAKPWMLYLLCLVAPLAVHATSLLFAIGKSFFPEKVTGTVIGFLNLVPFMFGAIMQSLIGRILAYFQNNPLYADSAASLRYGQAFKPVLAWAFLTVLAAFWLRRRSRETIYK
ncbi:MAG: MFS transporter [Deltaproteobacteria bacterium]|jgi:sugar phosphate permease|nr:MFS transporter [Deltaproteobacteria bacterium]